MVIYRLLIVDDEEIIVNGLYEIFNCMNDFEIDVYKAFSGEEAIEWLGRTRFDIVLTDIKMPGVDGLQLLDEIVQNWPQCRVIFLTGHNDFEYIYKAIQYKNVSYLLKTEDPEKVVTEVEKTIKDIEKGIKIENLIQQAKEQMDIVQDLFLKDYFMHLLHNDKSLEVSKEQFEQLSVPLQSENPVLLLIGRVENLPDNMNYWDKIQYLNSIGFVINKNLNTHISSINILDDSYRFVLIMQPKELFMSKTHSDENTLYRKAISFLKGTLEVVQSICRESLNATISFAISGTPLEWGNVAQRYYCLCQLLSYRLGDGTELLIVDDENSQNMLNTDTACTSIKADEDSMYMLLHQKKLDVFETYLESGQREKYFNALSELSAPLKTIKDKNSSIAVIAYYKIALSLLSYINRNNLPEKLPFFIGKNKLMQIDAYSSWEEALSYIYQVSDEIFKHQNDQEQTRADNTINFIHKFIEEHLDENLSLVRIAEQVYLNPSYLSRLYKQETGGNISHSIDSLRIEKAKELMKNKNLKIYEVAKAVGYDTPASFTRFFKRIAGVSPNEYVESVKNQI